MNERTARLNMRISPETLATLRDAAAVQQQDLTSLVLGAALRHARAVLVEDRILRLTPPEVRQVEAALDRDAEVVPELLALARSLQAAPMGQQA